MTPFDKDVTFEVVVGNYEGASFAPIGAVSFLWNAVEQKDLACFHELLFSASKKVCWL